MMIMNSVSRKAFARVSRLVLGLLIFVTAVTCQASFETSLRKFYTSSKPEAVREIKQLAEKGDVNAEAFLGAMYGSGDGVAQDYRAAIKWQTKAAKKGHVQAQYNLGVMYSRGMGVSQDLGMAVKWFQAAADQGLPEAHMHLGLFHEKGWVLRKCPYAASEEYYQAGEDYLARNDLKGARQAAMAIRRILPKYYLGQKLLTEIYMYEK